MNTYIFSKDVSDLTATQDLGLDVGETITSIVADPTAVTPVTPSMPTLSILSGIANPVVFSVASGLTNTTYGFPVIVTTSLRVFAITLVVIVSATTFDPYPSSDPGSYQDLVGSLQVGKTAVASTIFQFDNSFDPSGGYVVWDLLDLDGTIYSSGNAFEFKIISSGLFNTVTARSLINVPSTIPPTIDVPYQLRYSLRVGNAVSYSYESLVVVGIVDVPTGAQDQVELAGDQAQLTLVTEELYPNYVLELMQGNDTIASMPCPNPDKVSNGYFVAGIIDTTPLPASLIPYTVLWKFWSVPSRTYRENSSLYVINPSIIQATEDVKAKLNKARQTLFGTSDSQYTTLNLLPWLRRGMDAFNAAYGQFTNFDMTNAKGPIREFWLLYAEKMALEAQYLLNAEKAFNFQGAAISLDVDQTQYVDSMIGKIQGQLDAEVKALKQNLIMKNVISGDGSVSPLSGGARAMGAVGLTITPVSIYNAGAYYGRY